MRESSSDRPPNGQEGKGAENIEPDILEEAKRRLAEKKAQQSIERQRERQRQEAQRAKPPRTFEQEQADFRKESEERLKRMQQQGAKALEKLTEIMGGDPRQGEVADVLKNFQKAGEEDMRGLNREYRIGDEIRRLEWEEREKKEEDSGEK